MLCKGEATVLVPVGVEGGLSWAGVNGDAKVGGRCESRGGGRTIQTAGSRAQVSQGITTTTIFP